MKKASKLEQVMWPMIELPIDIMPMAEMRATCKYFNCELLPKKKGDAYYKIHALDATNFFWMGANINNALLNSLYKELQKLNK